MANEWLYGDLASALARIPADTSPTAGMFPTDAADYMTMHSPLDYNPMTGEAIWSSSDPEAAGNPLSWVNGVNPASRTPAMPIQDPDLVDRTKAVMSLPISFASTQDMLGYQLSDYGGNNNLAKFGYDTPGADIFSQLSYAPQSVQESVAKNPRLAAAGLLGILESPTYQSGQTALRQHATPSGRWASFEDQMGGYDPSFGQSLTWSDTGGLGVDTNAQFREHQGVTTFMDQFVPAALMAYAGWAMAPAIGSALGSASGSAGGAAGAEGAAAGAGAAEGAAAGGAAGGGASGLASLPAAGTWAQTALPALGQSAGLWTSPAALSGVSGVTGAGGFTLADALERGMSGINAPVGSGVTTQGAPQSTNWMKDIYDAAKKANQVKQALGGGGQQQQQPQQQQQANAALLAALAAYLGQSGQGHAYPVSNGTRLGPEAPDWVRQEEARMAQFNPYK